MTDPRALLEAYAEETDFYRGDLLDDREHEAPKAFAALRAVLDVIDEMDRNDLFAAYVFRLRTAVRTALEASA